MRSIRLLCHLAVGFASTILVVLSPAASAQTTLPQDVVTATTLSAAQEASLRRFVDEHGPKLVAEDARVRQQARNTLLRPLQGLQGDASKAFRLAFNRLLFGPSGPLNGLEGNEDIGVALSTLRIAGALSAENGFLSLRNALGDARAAIRYEAVKGIGETLAIESDGKGVMPAQRVDEAIAALEELLAKEADPLVIDAAAIALASPVEGSPIRVKGLTALARGMSKHIAARRQALAGDAGEQEMLSILRALSFIRDEVTRPNVDRGFAMQAGIVAGQTISYCMAHLAAGNGNDEGVRQRLLALARASESTLVFAHEALVRTDQVRPSIGEQFERALGGGPRDALQRSVNEWIGANGRLTREPYNVNVREFGAR